MKPPPRGDSLVDEGLQAMGRKAAAGFEQTTDAQLALQERLMLAQLAERNTATHSRRVSWRLWLAGAAGAAAIAAALLVALLPAGPQLRCLDSSGNSLVSGATLAGDETVHASWQAYRFSEGSRVGLGSGSQAVLERLDDRSVQISLAKGRLRSAIKSARERTWRFAAGPYRATVVGTQLAISWAPRGKSFELEVSKGRVLVTGGAIGPRGRTVSAGHRLLATVENVTVSTIAQPPSSADSVQAPQPEQVRPVSDPAAAAPRTKPRRPGKRPGGLDMRWKELSRAGHHERALDAAHNAGWRRLLDGLPASDLLLLADSARFARDAAATRSALLRVRQRFGQQHAGRIAAYRLGRLAADRLGDSAAAARWFAVFQQEAPKSALFADALAGEMLARKQLGDLEAAKRLAAGYLGRFPKGTYAATARQLVR